MHHPAAHEPDSARRAVRRRAGTGAFSPDGRVVNLAEEIRAREFLLPAAMVFLPEVEGISRDAIWPLEITMVAGSAGVMSLILSGPCLSASRWGEDQRRHLALMPDEMRGAILACEASGDFSSRGYQDAMMAFYRRHLCRMDPWPECLNRTLEKAESSRPRDHCQP